VILKAGSQGEDVALRFIPGNILHVSDIAKKGMIGALSDLLDLEIGD
jgi:hypothetical protein